MATKAEELRTVLDSLSRVGGIKASAVISADGLPIVPSMPENVDPNTFAAMIASMMGAAETALKSLGSSNVLKGVNAESDDATVVAVQAGADAILAMMVDPKAASNYGLIRIEANRASKEIARIMAE
ncbi:MAG: roadblock/LC7 domain-containing protein [Candidatus Parvarchaeota archaeon]|jgi:hypothetical protein|nr:roadblock/LC7 domain-containing protein [Candidatus Parvarchaeota archaeon]